MFSYRTRDNLAVIFGGLFILAIILLLPVSIWLQVAAPCKYVDWMPVKDVPARCLDGEDR